MKYFDAHFHLVPSIEQCGADSVLAFYGKGNHGITCAHTAEEFERQECFIKDNGLEDRLIQSFGIHPQLPLLSNAEYMEKLLKEKRIKLIGETGLDFFAEAFKSKKNLQVEAFHLCLELAESYNVPLVIHNRKALDDMLRETKALGKLPLVLFHSFAFSSREALSLLNHGVNAVFSFSKQILNGNKKSISCVLDLPLDRVFMETDAPFQTLKDEANTNPSEIERVYAQGAELKKMSLSSFCNENWDNYLKVFSSL